MTADNENSGNLQWPLTVLYDGTRPVSAREIDELKAKDKAGHLLTVDVAKDGFDAADYGLNAGEVRHELHVRDAAGHMLVGVDALQAAYDAVGIGSWFRYTRLPGMQSGMSAHAGNRTVAEMSA